MSDEITRERLEELGLTGTGEKIIYDSDKGELRLTVMTSALREVLLSHIGVDIGESPRVVVRHIGADMDCLQDQHRVEISWLTEPE